MSKRQKKQAQPEEHGATTPPPAYFLSVTVENVRCFGEVQTLYLSDGNGRPAQWTVILGDNGTGKTTLLQAIAALEPIKVSGEIYSGMTRPNRSLVKIWSMRQLRMALRSFSMTT